VKVGAYVDGGDSGGPAFSYDGSDGAAFYGVVFAADCISKPCGSLIFSPIAGIQSDLGSLNVVSDITVDTPSPSGTIDGSGQPVISWSAVSTTNTTAATTYYVYRYAWDSPSMSSSGLELLGTTTGTSWTDTTAPTVYSFAGGSRPNQCDYSSVWYYVRSYNRGIGGSSAYIYFQGPESGGGQFGCP
jgi:hypothetical protein